MRRATALILAGLLAPTATAAQEARIDSLEAALAAATEDTTRVRILYDLAAEHYVLAADSSISLSEQGLRLSQGAHYSPGIAAGHFSLGRSFLVAGNFERSLESLFTALESYESLADTIGQADTHYYLGELFYENDADQAGVYYEQYLALSRQVGDSIRIADGLLALGTAQITAGDYEAALDYFAEAQEILDHLSDRWSGGGAAAGDVALVRATILNNSGYAYYLRREYGEALTLFRRAVAALPDGGSGFQGSYFVANVGKALAGLGNWGEARQFASLAYQQALDVGAPVSVAYTAEFFQEVLSELGEYRMAHEVLKLSVAMRDSINAEEVNRQSLRRQLEHEHEKEVLALEKEQEKKQAITRMIIFWVVSGLGVLLFFSGWLLNRYRVIHQQSRVIAGQKNRMQDELNIARGIQMSLLPSTFPAFPERKELDLYAGLEPAREVGGDFYDYFFIDDDRLCVVVGDVSGKGAPAALFMAVSKTLLKSNAEGGSASAGTVLTRANEGLSRGNDSAMFVTVFLAILSTKTGDLEYSNAGHNPPYIRRESGELQRLGTRHGPVLGAVEGLTYGEDEVRLSRGDLLLLYTDGVTEAMDPAGQLFSEERLVEMLHSGETDSPESAVRWTIREVHNFEGEDNQADDITVLAVQAQGIA